MSQNTGGRLAMSQQGFQGGTDGIPEECMTEPGAAGGAIGIAWRSLT